VSNIFVVVVFVNFVKRSFVSSNRNISSRNKRRLTQIETTVHTREPVSYNEANGLRILAGSSCVAFPVFVTIKNRDFKFDR